jgi:hypothetical protein
MAQGIQKKQGLMRCSLVAALPDIQSGNTIPYFFLIHNNIGGFKG